ncbi:MAG: hypothetical protein QXG57_06180 [Thermofilaceae archaeon]
MKVKCEVKYSYRPEETHKCWAEVVIFLPIDEASRYGYLPSVLVDPNRELFGWVLGKDLGYKTSDGKWRIATKNVTADDWGTLEEKVNETIESAIEMLREVKRINEEMLATVPSDRVLEFEI